MNRLHLILLAICLISGTAAAATADTVGPFLDFDEPVSISATLTINTHFTWPIDIYDEIIIIVNLATDVRALAYVTFDAPGFEDDALVTTIYGKPVAPAVSGLETTGFDPVSPEITPLSGETIFGDSGTAYLSHFATGPTALSSLPTLFPDLDLSAFQGDSSSIVYAFQTSMPVSEIPEPATLSLLALGGLALIRRRK